MRKNERYENEITGDADGGRETVKNSSSDTQSAERQDGCAELTAAAEQITRARFTVRLDYSNRRMTVGLALAAVVIIGGLFMCFIHDVVTILIISGVIVAAIIAAIVLMCVISAKRKTKHYCYYERTERGVRCMSVIGERVVLFDGKAAYVFDDGEFMQLDADAYMTYLDGECSGLCAILNAKREDVEDCGDGIYFVNNSVGGGHTVYIENGKIVRIASAVPAVTDRVDKSGERVVKLALYEKTEMTDDFAWAIPERVQNELRERGLEFTIGN